MLQESGVAGVAKQDSRIELLLVKAIEDMTAHKPTGACEQYLQSDQVQLFSDRTHFVQGKVYLRVGVSCHEADSDQFVSGCDRGINDRVDENAVFLQVFAKLERQGHVAAVDGQDRRL